MDYALALAKAGRVLEVLGVLQGGARSPGCRAKRRSPPLDWAIAAWCCFALSGPRAFYGSGGIITANAGRCLSGEEALNKRRQVSQVP